MNSLASGRTLANKCNTNPMYLEMKTVARISILILRTHYGKILKFKCYEAIANKWKNNNDLQKHISSRLNTNSIMLSYFELCVTYRVTASDTEFVYANDTETPKIIEVVGWARSLGRFKLIVKCSCSFDRKIFSPRTSFWKKIIVHTILCGIRKCKTWVRVLFPTLVHGTGMN